ncbi:MAG: hypothetical protein ACYC41_11325, partial [Bacillota bacterium]
EFAKPREKIVAGSGYASPTAAARPGVKAILVLADGRTDQDDQRTGRCDRTPASALDDQVRR